MKTCVFVGPSSGNVELPEGVDRYTPAACGSVWRAVELGYERIAVVDGLFGNVPAVWHKEVLYALAHGVHVLGAASMGALRAAELYRYGMVGVGTTYRFVRAGLITDDDEVCVSHAPVDEAFAPRTLPMIAIRRTLAKLVRTARLERSAAEGICRSMKRLHFSERGWQQLEHAFESASPPASQAFAEFRERYVDLAVADYRQLVDALAHPRPAPRPLVWADLHTWMWQAQFVDQAHDIPPLQRW